MQLHLNPDFSMPAVGFGTYLIKDDEADACVSTALEVGYRHIDTAEGYGNEAGVGRAIASAALPREDLFVTTKLWPGNPAWGQAAKDKTAVAAALDASLEKLGLEYVDLYLIHAPFAGEKRLEQWEALVSLREEGKTAAIGVSNFNQAQLHEIEAAGLPTPDANQIELHPWSQKPELVSYLFEKGIVPIAYSSLIPLAQWRIAEGQASAKTDQMKEDGEKPDSPFAQLASKHNVSQAQILLKWALEKGYPVLPKSTDPTRIKTNFDLFSFELDSADMNLMAGLDRGDGVAWSSGDPTK